MALEPPAPPAAPGRIQRPHRPLPFPGQESFVLFHNTTKRMVNLYWCVHGNRTFHLSLAPGANSKTNTFTKHFWIFCDKDTNELLCVSHRKVFWPQSYQMPDPHNPSRMIPCRKEIKIHFPLRSLRENCLWRVVTTLHSVPPRVAMRIIDERMFIPNVLKNELKKRLRRKVQPEMITAEIVKSVIEQHNQQSN
ncbi:protein Vhl-like [Rhagoletis pomonella]|uniref:protein Vhl-like n=1 Tax=Rhagoletis pomonella TaxID=28610 RepID=UPI00177FAFDC|nr:protein Vhl-like [Rhagoletis pomonella]